MVEPIDHIVIIGGGIMGVCTAYYLSEDEGFKTGLFSVSVIEANEIASGASGKAGGFLALDLYGSETASLAQLSYALHQQLAEECNGETVYGYRKLRCLNAYAQFPDLQDTQLYPILPKSSVPFRALLPSEGGDPAVETKWLQGPNIRSLSLIAVEDTTAQVHPLLFTRALWDKAHARGVQYVKGRPVTWNQHTKTLNIDTPDGLRVCPASTLVVAAGPWSGQVSKQLLGLDVPISDLPGHSVLIRPSEPVSAHALFADIDKPGVTRNAYFFARPDGLVYVAGENHGSPIPEGTANVEPEDEHIRKLVLASAAISDSLGNGTVEVQQLCYRPVTPHGAPLVGALQSSMRAFIAAGHGQWGITLGPGTGKVMAELILAGVAYSADVRQLDPSPHVKLLPA